jgi:hypothetical protein
LGILTRHTDRRETVRRVLAKIATLDTSRRGLALSKLLVLAGLRKLGDDIRSEVEHMPLLDDIMDHEVLGPLIRDGMEKGLEKGKLEEGTLILRRLIAKRFGPLPSWAEERLAKLTLSQLEDLSLRVLDAQSMTDMFDR